MMVVVNGGTTIFSRGGAADAETSGTAAERRQSEPGEHGKKLLTYLRLTNQRVGLLINFGGNTLMEGLRRVVNDLPPSASPRLSVNQSV